jgi:hypothetical protein
MVPRQREVLRLLARSRGHKDLVAFCAACGVPRISLYRAVAGVARDATVAKVARKLGLPLRDLREIIELGGPS